MLHRTNLSVQEGFVLS